MEKSDLVRRCRDYAEQYGLTLGEQLGTGVQGIVFSAQCQVEGGWLALKAHKQEPDYVRERDAYLRLQARGMTKIRGCNVPKLIVHDDDAWIIVMTIVKRPFVLDFGGAYLDQPPEFSEDVWAEWELEKQEQFGARWAEVRAIINELQQHGIFLVDVNPRNISFDN